MRNLLQKHKSEGFTIIEVMIVLAIAALILLIVLLAVPALQRNSRNTTIKNDAATVAGGVNTYESDNNGTVPTSVAGTGSGVVVSTGVSDTNKETIVVSGGTTVTSTGTAPSGTGVGATGKTAAGTILVRTKEDCSGTVNNRAVAIWYVIEASGGTSQQCVTN